MLTRAKIGRDQDLTHDSWIGAAFTGLLLFGVMAYSLIDAFGWTRTPLPADTRIATINGSNTATVSDSIFSQYLVPFRSEEHTSELQSLMRISYAVFCLKKKKKTIPKL